VPDTQVLRRLKLTKKIRKLKGIHFDFKGAHLAYTDESQGGAASKLNDPFLLKSTELDKPLTENQKKILEDIEEESVPLDKSTGAGKNTPSSSEETGEDNDNINKGTDNDMSEEILKQLAEVKHELAITKAEKQISPYSFGELETGVATALANASKEDAEAINKALTFLKECGEYGAAEAAVSKAKGKTKELPDNALTKALDEEAGLEGDGDNDIAEPSKLDNIEKAMQRDKTERDGGTK